MLGFHLLHAQTVGYRRGSVLIECRIVIARRFQRDRRRTRFCGRAEYATVRTLCGYGRQSHRAGCRRGSAATTPTVREAFSA